MGKRRIRNTPNAEGSHGSKTHLHLVRELESGAQGMPVEQQIAVDRMLGAEAGKRRLAENREQHDHGEKNSEFTRRHDGDGDRRDML
jgi:hypothetical protein